MRQLLVCLSACQRAAPHEAPTVCIVRFLLFIWLNVGPLGSVLFVKAGRKYRVELERAWCVDNEKLVQGTPTM